MHPYKNLPDTKFWKKFVTTTDWRSLSIGGNVKFILDNTDKIATAGSCFAQHITRHLQRNGLNTYFAETQHPISIQFGESSNSYDLFSARYGNIYTARQCLELFQQAFGEIECIIDFTEYQNRIYDLLRPSAIPNGFLNTQEAYQDRIFHLGCVKKMFETCDVFILTLGLTECWYSSKSNHTYPSCPGTVKGEYNPDIHKFKNFSYTEILSDLQALISRLKTVNPKANIILTVSPVPLVATQTNNNVLVASSYSKSVLRAVCGELNELYENVQHFPSYEIVNHVCSFGQYLSDDLRDISERGVNHVMDTFIKTFFKDKRETLNHEDISINNFEIENSKKEIENRFISAECDELFNEII
jgi:hypothetical protein